MSKKFLVAAVAALIVLPIAFFGCKAKTATDQEAMITEATGPIMPQEEGMVTQPIEPAQTVATETIPATAVLPASEKPAMASQGAQDRNKDIQRALQAAGFYSGAIDGKIGPKTKRAITEFQKAKGLKVDGKVGPKTWAELEKYLTIQQ